MRNHMQQQPDATCYISLQNKKCIFSIFESNTKIESIIQIITIPGHVLILRKYYSAFPSLSKNEFRILQLIVDGMDVPSVAFLCGLKPSTVYSYRERIAKKLGFCRAGLPFRF
ncbi:helix-turn-helix transcriptional regulator [Cedecea sp. MMO-103]|uniref:helix-turn-helix transcriptional regulator n=1 Tax=Cedecea sp. MMO-103 TaxID=3081238 RepID=UPI003FA53977